MNKIFIVLLIFFNILAWGCAHIPNTEKTITAFHYLGSQMDIESIEDYGLYTMKIKTISEQLGYRFEEKVFASKQGWKSFVAKYHNQLSDDCEFGYLVIDLVGVNISCGVMTDLDMKLLLESR